METYAANGEAYFALEVIPQVAEPQRQPHDIAVLFDTSASQTGSFRKKGLAALHQLLANLDAVDRVALLAVDVNAIGLTPGLQKADSAEMSRCSASYSVAFRWVRPIWTARSRRPSNN